MKSLTVAGWRILAVAWAAIIAGLMMGRPPSWLAGASVALGIAAFSVFAVSAAIGARKFLRGRRDRRP